MDRLSIVREVYHTSADPQRVKRAFELTLKINQRILDKAKAAAHREGNYNWPFPKAPSLAVQLDDAGVK